MPAQVNVYFPSVMAKISCAGMQVEHLTIDIAVLQHNGVIPQLFDSVIGFRFPEGEYADFAPITYEHCNQTIFTGPDGRATQVSPGTTIDYTAYDLYDRPRAKIWEEYFEDGMSRPEEDDSLGGFR